MENDYEQGRNLQNEIQGVIGAPCPNCGGKVWFCFVFDWPSHLGGDYVCDVAECSNCENEWLTSEAPREFFTEDNKHWKVKGATC